MKRLYLVALLAIVHMDPVVSQSLLHDLLAAPYTSDLVRNRSGDRAAWVTSTAGVKSIHMATSPGYIANVIWQGIEDDGLPISHLTFDVNSDYLYFNRGSGPNREGQIANPLSYSHYPSQLLMRVALTTGRIDTIGEYGNYQISHKGDFLLIAKGREVLKINTTDLKIEKVLTSRGAVSSIQISSDDSAFVFQSNRNDHSFIGYYAFGNDRITWLSPSVDKDIIPKFSPDNAEVVFIRQPGDQQEDLYNITGGVSFELIVHNLKNNTSRSIWRSPADDGGFAQWYPSDPIHWTLTNRILFYSEHEGFIKLYSIAPDGTGLQSLISGITEVEHIDISPDGEYVIFNANRDDIDRRDLYQYTIRTNTLKQLSATSEIETDPIAMGDGSILFRNASHDHFPTISRCSLSNPSKVSRISDLNDSKWSSDHVTPEQVIFRAQYGTIVHGQLFVKDKAGSKPAVLFMHGGPIRQMLLGYHYSSYYANAYAFNQYLANQGYVVLSVNYRAGIGYGREFRRAPNQGPRGASEYQDILAAAAYLMSQDYVDAERIGLWGGSYGGLLTAQGLARNSNIFKAGVDLHGVHDWSWRARDFSEGGAWGIGPDDMALARASSPIADLSGWTSPVLFVHGDDDRNVMFGQTIDFVRRLRDKGVDHEILVFPDEVHGFYRYESWYRTFDTAADFFNRKLKN